MMIYLICMARPKSLELGSLMYLLDQRNYPMTRHRLGEDLDFLRGAGLLRVTTPASEILLSENQQEKFLHSFAVSDGERDNDFCVRPTTKGINFQEGHIEEIGVLRVS